MIQSLKHTFPVTVQWSILLLILLCNTSDRYLLVRRLSPVCCLAKEIEVTNEWQVVGENDTVPAGVHVRMDLSTGGKWVKLASDDDHRDDHIKHQSSSTISATMAPVNQSSSSSTSSLVSMAIVNEDGSVQLSKSTTETPASSSEAKSSSSSYSYDFDMMHRTLSKLPDDEHERMGGLPELPQAKDESKRVTPEQRKAFEERMLEIWKRRQEELSALYEQMMDVPAILKERIKGIDEYLKDPQSHLNEVDLDAELPEGIVTHIVSVLDDLQFLMSDVDMARDFHSMGGWPLLVSLLSEDSHVPVNKTAQDLGRASEAKIRTIQSLAAGTMGTAVKNTAEFSSFVVEQVVIENGTTVTTAIDLLLDVFCRSYNDGWESRMLLSKSISAIGAMLRGNRLAQTHVLQRGGFGELAAQYKALSSHERFNSANIKLLLRFSSLVSDIVEDVQLHPEFGDSMTNKGIIDALTSWDWCDATCQVVSSEAFLPVKVQESILHSVAVLTSYCQWGDKVESMKQSIGRMRAEWESNEASFDIEHLQQMSELAQRALDAMEEASGSTNQQ
jgi:nucleotide exchange factor SIL1